MSTHGYIIVEDDYDNRAYVRMRGDAYPDQVERVVTRFLDTYADGDLFGLSAQEKADALVYAVESVRELEYPMEYNLLLPDGSGGRKVKTTTLEYSEWLSVETEPVDETEAEGNGFKLFTLTPRYELFSGRRLRAERTERKPSFRR